MFGIQPDTLVQRGDGLIELTLLTESVATRSMGEDVVWIKPYRLVGALQRVIRVAKLVVDDGPLGVGDRKVGIALQ